MILHVTPLHPGFAAEVSGGLDLAAPLPDAVLGALRTALGSYRLLVLRDQRLTPGEQVAFTRRLGAPAVHVAAGAQLPDQPEVVLETDATDGRVGFGLGGRRWHADLSYTPQPNRISALHARSLPLVGGAVTLFADQCAAHDLLDAWLAHHVQFLEAEHDLSRRSGHGAGELPPVAHPVVRVDPETGRRSLFVDEDTTTRLLGLPEPEAARLLRRLHAAATDGAVTYRHGWRRGDLVLWDNQTVLHRTEPTTTGQSWRMHRTMVAGARPLGPAAVLQPWVMAG
jgi:taurine dioxygenase